MTNAEARFNKSLRPRKPEGSLGRTAQDVHLDSHTAPELWQEKCWFITLYILLPPMITSQIQSKRQCSQPCFCNYQIFNEPDYKSTWKKMWQVCFLFHSCWLYSSCLFTSGYLTSKTWNVSPEPQTDFSHWQKKEDKALTWAGAFVPVQCPVHATAANCSPWTSGQTQVTAHVVGTRARVTCCTQRNKTGLGVNAVHANM